MDVNQSFGHEIVRERAGALRQSGVRQQHQERGGDAGKEKWFVRLIERREGTNHNLVSNIEAAPCLSAFRSFVSFFSRNTLMLVSFQTRLGKNVTGSSMPCRADAKTCVVYHRRNRKQVEYEESVDLRESIFTLQEPEPDAK